MAAVIGAVSLLAGVLLGFVSASLPSIHWTGLAGLLLILWLLSPWRQRAWPCACAMLLAGQLLAGFQVRDWLAKKLSVEGADTRMLAEGIIESVPERHGLMLRFDLRTGSRQLLRVHWRDPHAMPRVGERWRLLLRLSSLEETRNFAGFDSARQAFRDGVHGAGRVLPSAMNELLRLAPARLDTARARIAIRVRAAIADPDAAALVTALAVGLTAGMSHDQWRVFNATGTTHLVAISGLHVTMFAWLVFRLARFSWRWLPGRQLLDREPFALLLGLAAAGGYALLAGFSVPTQRTWLMLALYVMAKLSARQVGAGRLWSLALVCVLLLDVRAPLAAGFWLSFIAVGVLLGLVDNAARPGATQTLWLTVRTQLAIMVALAPAGLAIFSGLSVQGLVVNLIAIPVISLLFVPVVLAGAVTAWLAPGLDWYCFTLSATLYEWLWPPLVSCADVASLWRISPPGWWFALALPASLVCLCRWHWALRFTAGCAVLPLLFAPARTPPAGSAIVQVLDVGSGSLVLIRTAGHVLMFDSGDAWNTRGSRLRDQGMAALDAADISQVDRLLLPALNDDRAHAAALLAHERGMRQLWAGGGWPGSRLPVTRCRDTRWDWDGVRLVSHAIGRYCLLRVSVQGFSLLLAGDLDAEGERQLLARLAPGGLVSDVLLMGRQVGDGASSPEWIENTAPGLAIASGGVDGASSRNRVIERWRRSGSRILDTRRDGGVELKLSSRGIETRTVVDSRYPFPWRRVSAALQRPPV